MAKPQGETPESENRIELGYYPVKDALVGSTHAENVKHVLTRLAFMDVMFEDKRVNELWWNWGKYTGVNEAAGKMALNPHFVQSILYAFKGFASLASEVKAKLESQQP